MFISEIEEKSFLLKNVMQISVLTHAETFQKYDVTKFLDFVSKGEKFAEDVLLPLTLLSNGKGVRVEKETVRTPEGFKKAWKMAIEQGWFKITSPEKYEGIYLPESVCLAIQEAFFAANPSFYYYLMFTVELAKLIERFGDELQKNLFCQNLFGGIWSGAYALAESQYENDWKNIQTQATCENDIYHISGTKTAVVCGNHDLTKNNIHLVLARLKERDGKLGEIALFIVPAFCPLPDKLKDNNVRLEKVHQISGINGAPFCTVSYGKNGDCRGYLLKGVGLGLNCLKTALEGIRLQIALQGAALSGAAYAISLDYANKKSETIKEQDLSDSEDQALNMIDYLHVADSLMYQKAFSEGIRNAVYMAAFFLDCSFHGGQKQKEYFSDLAQLYILILKVYATDMGLISIKHAISILGESGYYSDSLLGQFYRDLEAGTILGSVNHMLAGELQTNLLLKHDGRLFQNLIKQFKNVEIHLARTEILREAIGIWNDYIGGIIVLFDDLQQAKSKSDSRQWLLFAEKILKLFGDVIICYHLICQGLEAEKLLEENQVNFFNLKQEIIGKPALRIWYNKLITAEYFALHVLSQQESCIHLIQRNPSSVLDTWLENE